jgi:hypothetical protein
MLSGGDNLQSKSITKCFTTRGNSEINYSMIYADATKTPSIFNL